MFGSREQLTSYGGERVFPADDHLGRFRWHGRVHVFTAGVHGPLYEPCTHDTTVYTAVYTDHIHTQPCLPPVHGLVTAMYTVRTRPCTGSYTRVHGSYMAINMACVHSRVHDRVDGRVLGRVHGRVHGGVTAVYTYTRPAYGNL